MLKQLRLKKQLEMKREALKAINEESAALETREQQCESALEEATTDEDIKVVDEEISAIETEKASLTERKGTLEIEINAIEQELEQLNSKSPSNEEQARSTEKTQGGIQMRFKGQFRNMNLEQRSELVAKNEVKDFLDNLRNLKTSSQTRSVTGAELLIPEVILDLLRDNLDKYSKLIGKVYTKPLKGQARVNVMGTIPEAIWTEAVGSINKLELLFSQIEIDGYKVAGFVVLPNTTIDDADTALIGEVLEALAQSIGLAVDKSIVYGTGKKMPLGFATRLAQTEQPSDWPTKAPAWTNLSVSNVKKFAGASLTGTEFFAQLLGFLGIARPNYAVGGTIWLMNRKTKMTLLAKALAFNAAGAVVAGMNNQMPVEGGEIIELDFIADNDILGGFGSVYYLVERAGTAITPSEHAQFLDDNTVFKGVARYDGKPVFGESFVAININNQNPTMTATFSPDLANPADAYLSELKIGSLTLSPTFSGAVSDYTVETTNATNAVTATAAVSKAVVVIKVNNVVATNGATATWSEGANTVEVTVTNGTTTKTYTVTVTKS